MLSAWSAPKTVTVHCNSVRYLVGVVHEVHWDAEWQWMVVGVSQQDGHDLHTWRLGLPLPILQCSLHRPLTVHCILPHLTPVWKRKRDRDANNALKRLQNWFQLLWSFYVSFEGITGQLQALCDSPWVSIALQVLSQVPKEMLLRKEQSHTQRQQLPTLQGEVVREKQLSFAVFYALWKRKLSLQPPRFSVMQICKSWKVEIKQLSLGWPVWGSSCVASGSWSAW